MGGMTDPPADGRRGEPGADTRTVVETPIGPDMGWESITTVPSMAAAVTLPVTWSVAPVEGQAVSGEALVTDVPLSLWGGFDPGRGVVIDERHPLRGATLCGRVLVMPSGRGSCSASGVLLESICLGTGPAAILTHRPDPILTLGSVLAEELHGLTVPVGTLAGDVADYMGLTGQTVTLTPTGITIGAEKLGGIANAGPASDP